MLPTDEISPAGLGFSAAVGRGLLLAVRAARPLRRFGHDFHRYRVQPGSPVTLHSQTVCQRAHICRRRLRTRGTPPSGSGRAAAIQEIRSRTQVQVDVSVSDPRPPCGRTEPDALARDTSVTLAEPHLNAGEQNAGRRGSRPSCALSFAVLDGAVLRNQWGHNTHTRGNCPSFPAELFLLDPSAMQESRIALQPWSLRYRAL